jgi:hypothetical protein
MAVVLLALIGYSITAGLNSEKMRYLPFPLDKQFGGEFCVDVRITCSCAVMARGSFASPIFSGRA